MNKQIKEIFNLGKYQCRAVWTKYKTTVSGHERNALILYDAQTGEPIATVSINLVDALLMPDEMAINHDLPVDMLQDIIDAGLIEAPHRYHRPDCSFVNFAICRINKGNAGINFAGFPGF